MNAPLISTSAKAPSAQLPYLPGLDGLRAIAVIAVVLYHADLQVWGGFLGVEAFFVLSGFLITSLLMIEWNQSNRIRLGTFWIRRARRLLPALLLVIATVVGFTLLRLPTETDGLLGDTLAALGYVMNWHLVLGNTPYFDPFARPPLLQHVWSLAIEEQFYILWPLLFVVGMRCLRRVGLLLVVLVAAVGSTALMIALYTPGVDASRVYYGTDTRATALLLGVALALVWLPGQVPTRTSRTAGWLLDLSGMIALMGLLAGFALIHDYQPSLYKGGFALISLATAVVIAAVAHPQARIISTLLGMAPLRWIGRRSYGIYLWHWPIFVVTRPYTDVSFDGWQLFAVRIGLTLALTELSYQLVEMPIRSGGLARLGNWMGRRRDVGAISAADASHQVTLTPVVAQIAPPEPTIDRQNG